jgi:hypothetical protein
MGLSDRGKVWYFISDDVFREINRCPEPKGQKLLDLLSKIDYIDIQIDPEAVKIADEIILKGILKEKYRVDCTHIGCALISECDYLLSWNFADLACPETNEGVRMISYIRGYKSLKIVSPFNLKFREE